MSGEPVREALDALGLPPRALWNWLEDRRAWCERHGGRSSYADVLDLIEECLRECLRTDTMS